MASQTRGSSKKARRSTKSGPAKTKKTKSSVSKTAKVSDSERFVRDLLIRGEAAKPTEDGELPPGATHRIVRENEGELPDVERERFSIY
jgi:hypothetical protein